MLPTLIDTHCHLETTPFKNDLDSVLENAEEVGVAGAVLPGADSEDLPAAQELAEKYNSLFFAVGVHPYHADQYAEGLLEKYTPHPKCIAIGECGLDYYRLPKEETEILKEKKRQQEVFRAHIRYAKKVGLPLIVHIRDASEDSLKILLEEDAGEVGGVLHCYNADEQLLKLADHDFYYGIGGVLTFKNARKLVQMIGKIPEERIVLETDAPYLTPHPHRGKRNEPAYLELVAQKIAELRSWSYEKVCEVTTNNAKRLFQQDFGLAS